MDEFIPVVTVLFVSVVFHEVAHGWVAYLLGDSTAYRSGRLTLNPLKHIDPVGTLLVPTVLKLMGLPPFGWAKPVPINFLNFKRPQKDMIWVALAGPLTNVILALSASTFLRLWPLPLGFGRDLLTIIVFLNLLLAIFNLIPIPPLDGSRIVMGLLPMSLVRKYAQIEPIGLFLVFAALLLGLLDVLGSVVLFLCKMLGLHIIRL